MADSKVFERNEEQEATNTVVAEDRAAFVAVGLDDSVTPEQVQRIKVPIGIVKEGKNFLKNFLGKQEFIDILRRKGIILAQRDAEGGEQLIAGEGGFGIVCACVPKEGEDKFETVVKISQTRGKVEPCCDGYFVPLSRETDSAYEIGQKSLVKEVFNREAHAYKMLDEDDKEKVAKPFSIEVVDENGHVLDYLNIVQMPKYQKLSERIPVFNEKEVLKMVRDILEDIDKADGIRHRDIKVDNIMYYQAKDSYVLIDWGASCRQTDNNEFSFLDKTGIVPFYTTLYVDPMRLESLDRASGIDNIAQVTDIYSLGVVMAYLAHPKGYYAGKSIKAFHDEVCPEEAYVATVYSDLNQPIMAKDIYETLDHVTSGYRDIVRKAMNHTASDAYKAEGTMISAIDQLINPGGVTVTKEIKKTRGCKINWLAIPMIAVFLCAYTWCLSATTGLKGSIFGDEGALAPVMGLVICSFLPWAVIVTRIALDKSKAWYLLVRRGDVITLLVWFAIMSLSSAYFLKDLNHSITVDTSCFQFLFAILVFAISVLLGPTKLWSGIITGGLAGLCVAFCICNGIENGNFLSALTMNFAKLTFLLLVLGVLCGGVMALIRYWGYTKGVKVEDLT